MTPHAPAESPGDDYERRLAARRRKVAGRLGVVAAIFATGQFFAAAAFLVAAAENDLDLLVASLGCLGASTLAALAGAVVLALNWTVATKRMVTLGLGPWVLTFFEVTAIALLNI